MDDEIKDEISAPSSKIKKLLTEIKEVILMIMNLPTGIHVTRHRELHYQSSYTCSNIDHLKEGNKI